MSIKDIQNEIIDEFSLFEDWMQKYEYLIELGKSIKPIKEENKIDSNLIKGCQSKLGFMPNSVKVKWSILQTAKRLLLKELPPYC